MHFTDLYSDVNKLKMSQNNIEKGAGDYIRHLDNLYGTNLQEESRAINLLRDQKLLELKKNIMDIINTIHFLKTQVNDTNLLNINIEKMKKHMLALENCTNMLKYKIVESLQELNKQEKDLTIDLTNIERKFNECNNNKDKESSQYSTCAGKYVKNHELLQEVKDFLQYLHANGGHQGGWCSKDHTIFINMYNRIKKRNSLIQALLKMFPDMTEEQIESHINWYDKYIELGNIQRIAIEKWRNEKNKKQKIPPKEESLVPKTEKNINCTENREFKKFVKRKIKVWQANKQEKIDKEIILKNKKSKNLKQKEQQKSIYNREKREQVMLWKATKLAKKEAEATTKQIITERQKERNVLLAKKLIKEYQNQDNEFIHKRMSKRKIIKQQQKQEDEQKLIKMQEFNEKYAIRSNQFRKPTKTWLNKTKIDDNQQTNDMLIKYHTMKTIQKLRTPAWRMEISHAVS